MYPLGHFKSVPEVVWAKSRRTMTSGFSSQQVPIFAKEDPWPALSLCPSKHPGFLLNSLCGPLLASPEHLVFKFEFYFIVYYPTPFLTSADTSLHFLYLCSLVFIFRGNLLFPVRNSWIWPDTSEQNSFSFVSCFPGML